MAAPRQGIAGRLRARLASHLAEPQHQNAYYLMMSTGLGAATGVVFWFLLARVANLPPAEIGIGYSLVALGTTVALVAKGGFDTALLRKIPAASRREAAGLLRFGIAITAGAALLLSLALAVAASPAFPDVGPGGWALVSLLGLFLVVTWLQDAYYLADGQARLSFARNLAFSVARLVLPIPIVLLALPYPVALSWALALAVSAAAGLRLARHLPHREGRTVPRAELLQVGFRNLSGSAAEFLPGLLLVPLVLALDGPEAAGHFGIAWTAASLLFLASAAISRSALAEIVRNPARASAPALRRAVLQHLWIVLPGAALGVLLAPHVLGIFGPSYARGAGTAFALLCASALVVSPFYLYLTVLRAQDRPLALVAYPLAMLLVLAAIAPPLESRYALTGLGAAWILANLPFGAYGALRLLQRGREVTPYEPPTLHRRAHLE